MTLLQVSKISLMMSRQVTKRTSLHETGRWLSADCFMLLTRYFLASDAESCWCCVVAECAFLVHSASLTHRQSCLISAHFLSIECCEGKHQNRFVFCLHNDFVWRTQQTQFFFKLIKCFFPPLITGSLSLRVHTSLKIMYFNILRNIHLCYNINSSPFLQLPDISQYTRPHPACDDTRQMRDNLIKLRNDKLSEYSEIVVRDQLTKRYTIMLT